MSYSCSHVYLCQNTCMDFRNFLNIAKPLFSAFPRKYFLYIIPYSLSKIHHGVMKSGHPYYQKTPMATSESYHQSPLAFQYSYSFLLLIRCYCELAMGSESTQHEFQGFTANIAIAVFVLGAFALAFIHGFVIVIADSSLVLVCYFFGLFCMILIQRTMKAG